MVLNEALVGLGDQRGMVVDVPLDSADAVVKRVQGIQPFLSCGGAGRRGVRVGSVEDRRLGST